MYTGTVSKASAAPLVYERLKSDIAGFALMPGQRLVELELGERYGVSWSPVRDALGRLEIDNFVTRRPRGGRYVQTLDLAAYRDVYGVRVALETFAIREAFVRIDAVDLDELEEAWRECFPSATTPLDGSYVFADERFHLGIAKASGNGYLVSTLHRINDRLREIRSVDFTVRDRFVDSEAQHLAIVRAHGDADESARLMERHITESMAGINAISLRILDRIYGGGA